MQKKYIIKEKSKYLGDPETVVYRSSWEKAFFVFLEEASVVKFWASEEIKIQYLLLTDKKFHRYYPDVVLELETGDKFIVEIKPFGQRILKGGKGSGRRGEMEFVKNMCKWNAAREVAKDNGIHFIILDEYDLRRIGVRIPVSRRTIPSEKILYEKTSEFGRSVEILTAPLLKEKKKS